MVPTFRGGSLLSPANISCFRMRSTVHFYNPLSIHSVPKDRGQNCLPRERRNLQAPAFCSVKLSSVQKIGSSCLMSLAHGKRTTWHLLILAGVQLLAIKVCRLFWTTNDAKRSGSVESKRQSSQEQCLCWAGVQPLEMRKGCRNFRFWIYTLHWSRQFRQSRGKPCITFPQNVYMRPEWAYKITSGVLVWVWN